MTLASDPGSPHASGWAGALRPWHGLFVLGLLAADHATKAWARAAVPEGGPSIDVLPVLAITRAWNTGISFSLFADSDARWILAGLALMISGGLLAWVRSGTDRVTTIALLAIIGGALGNVIDRIWFGAVYDFVLAHWRGWAWPAFNLADSAISLGAVTLVFKSLVPSGKIAS